MDLSTFDPSSASRTDTIAAQRALRAALCYNGALDGDFGWYSKAALKTWGKIQDTGANPVKFVHRSAILVLPDQSIWWIGPAEVDGDGSGGNIEHDPDFQPDTSLHYDGRAINSRTVPGVVVTIGEINAVPGIVLGCQAWIKNILTGQNADAVVYDTGGPEDDGEISICAAQRIGIPSSPTTGGDPRPIVRYHIFPGRAATVDGVTYSLTAL